MDVVIWIMLTICAIFFTVLMLIVERYVGIRGFSIFVAIISLVLWVVAGLSAIDLTSIATAWDGSQIVEYTIHYSNSWVIMLLHVLACIFPFLIILKKIPETFLLE